MKKIFGVLIATAFLFGSPARADSVLFEEFMTRPTPEDRAFQWGLATGVLYGTFSALEFGTRYNDPRAKCVWDLDANQVLLDVVSLYKTWKPEARKAVDDSPKSGLYVLVAEVIDAKCRISPRPLGNEKKSN